jgi:hypothetical protein
MSTCALPSAENAIVYRPFGVPGAIATVSREITPEPTSEVGSEADVSTTVPTYVPSLSGTASLAFSRLLPASSTILKLCSAALIEKNDELYVRL